MNPQLREQLRISLLRHLDANASHFGLSEPCLLQHIRADGLSLVSLPDVSAELSYLEDKGLARCALKIISPELRAWQATAAGRDFFATLTA